MLILSEDARVICGHVPAGLVAIGPTQGLVRVDGRLVLVESDPERKGIGGCINAVAGNKPCTSTQAVEMGYSDLLRIDGRRVCLDTVTGLTDGTPPGGARYHVDEAGQVLVSQDP